MLRFLLLLVALTLWTVSVGPGGPVQVMSSPVPSGTPSPSAPPHTYHVSGHPSALAVDEPDGRAFIIVDGCLATLNLHSGASTLLLPDVCNFVALAVDPDHHHLIAVTGSDARDPSGYVSIIDPRTGHVAHTTVVDMTPVAVALDPQTGHAFVLHTNVDPSTFSNDVPLGTVAEVDPLTGKVVRRVTVGHGPTGLAVAGAARSLIVTNGPDDSATIISLTPSRRVRTVPLGGFAVAVADAGAGHMAVTVLDAHLSARSLCLLDARTGAVLSRVRAGSGPQALATDPQRGHVFVATDTGITTIDSRTGALLRQVALEGGPHLLAVNTRTGNAFAVDTVQGRVTVVSAAGALIGQIAVGAAPAAVVVNPRANRVYVSNGDSATVSAFADAFHGSPRRPSPSLARGVGLSRSPDDGR